MIEVKESEDGQFFFVVKGANGEIVATSELYTRKDDAERGAEDLQQILVDRSYLQAIENAQAAAEDPSRATDAEAAEQIELEVQDREGEA